MSTCSNCYNGCTEIISDRCVRYTGIDVPALGITTGDTLSHVEESIVNFLVPVLNGVGIKPVIDDNIICNLVRANLPTCTTCTGFTLNEVLTAIIKSVCDLQEQIDILGAVVADIEAPYTTGCLTVAPGNSITHRVLQATINKLCALNAQFLQLLIDLPNTYVAIADLDVLIQDYLNSTTGNLISNKMVPYSVLPYFGPITFFDSSGAGTGDWNKIYLCNGNNGTPDLRGRALTGVINGVPGPTLSPVVDPAISPANPNYSLYDVAGANQITLTSTQIPVHTHANTVNTVLTDPGHTHSFNKTNDYTSGGQSATSGLGVDGTQLTASSGINGTGITAVTTITNVAGPVGGGLPHANIQPVTACYYIQYRP